MKIKTIIVNGSSKIDEIVNKFLQTVDVTDVKPFYMDVDSGMIAYVILYEDFKSL